MPDQPAQASPAFPNLGQAVLLSLGVLLAQIGSGGLVVGINVVTGGEIKDSFNPWILAVVNVAAIGLALALGLRATRESARRFFTPRSFAPRLLPAMVITALGLSVVLHEVVNFIMEGLRLLPGFKDFSAQLKLDAFPLGTFVLAVLVAPLTEEYLFRGMILRGLLIRHRATTAVMITALLFGLVHANPPQILLGFVIGVVFGWWYVRTQSIGPCLVGHMAFNSVACCAVVFPELSALGFNYQADSLTHQPGWLTAGGATLAAAGLWWFHRIAGYPEPAAEPPLLPPVPDVIQPPREPPLLSPAPDAVQPPASPAS